MDMSKNRWQSIDGQSSSQNCPGTARRQTWTI